MGQTSSRVQAMPRSAGARPRSRGTRVLLALAVAAALVWWWSRTSPADPLPTAREPVAAARGSEPHQVQHRPAATSPTGPTSTCDPERADLASAEAEARDACAAEIAVLDCVPPVPFPFAVPPPDAVRAQVEEILSSCGDAAPRGLVLLCDEYPCWLAVPRDALDAPTSCARFEEVKRWAGAAHDADRDALLGDRWTPLPLGRIEGSLLADAIEARVPTTLGALARLRDAATGAATLHTHVGPNCDEVRRQRAALDGPTRCDALLEAWGCASQQPTTQVEPATVRAIVTDARAAWQDLTTRCPTLAQADATLDCESVPCLVRFSPTEGVGWDETVCFDPAFTYEFRKGGSGADVTIVAPVVTPGVLQLPGVLNRWLEEAPYRVWALREREAAPTD